MIYDYFKHVSLEIIFSPLFSDYLILVLTIVLRQLSFRVSAASDRRQHS